MFAVDHVLDVAGHDVVGFEGLVDTVNEILILWIVEVSDTEHLLGFGGSFFGEGASLIFDVDFVIFVFAEIFDEAVSDLILGSSALLAAGNDKWGTGFVDENGVGFIAFSPLAQGLLTGRYLDGIPEGSRMSKNKFLRPEMLTDELLAQLHEWNKEAESKGQSLAEKALRWILDQQGVTSVLVGASSAQQLEQNLRCV